MTAHLRSAILFWLDRKAATSGPKSSGESTNFGLGGDDFVLGGASFSYTAHGGAGRDVLEGSPFQITLAVLMPT